MQQPQTPPGIGSIVILIEDHAPPAWLCIYWADGFAWRTLIPAEQPHWPPQIHALRVSLNTRPELWQPFTAEPKPKASA
jgi:hypothetical protein